MRRVSCLLLVCFLAGCGSSGPKPLPLYGVTGTVTVNGNPLANTLVQFMPVDPSSKAKPGAGMTDAQGKYVLFTNGDKGANVGKYKVVLGAAAEQTGEMSLEEATKMSGEYAKTGGRAPQPKLAFPKEWASAKTTPKEEEVIDRAIEVDIDI